MGFDECGSKAKDMEDSKNKRRTISNMRFHTATQFRIEAPSGKLKSFRIRFKEPNGKWTQISLPEIDAANKLYREEIANFETTKVALKQVLTQLYARRNQLQSKIQMHSANVKLVELIYAEKYDRQKLSRMKNPENPKLELMQVVRACGPKYSLATCDLNDLDEHLGKLFIENPRKRYRIITWANVILRYLGRRTLSQIDPPKSKVNYITEEDLVQKLLPATTDKLDRILYAVAFYTGLRLGEIFSLQEEHVRAHTLWVESQMLEDGRLVDYLKRGTESHDAILPNDAVGHVKAWCNIPIGEFQSVAEGRGKRREQVESSGEKTRREIRHRKHAERLTEICKRLWPNNPRKHLRFHDLRHSNAIWLLENTDLKLSEIAQHLGNSAAVVERFYSGHQIKRGAVDRAAQLLNSRKKRWENLA